MLTRQLRSLKPGLTAVEHSPLEPFQVLYQYPEGKPITPDAAHFCFPHGVQPSLLERTPSMSALNELVYSQHYQHSDASSFIFVLKVGIHSP